MSRLVTTYQYIYILKKLVRDQGQGPGTAKFTGPGPDLLMDSLYTCKDGLCTGDRNQPGHAHTLPGVTHALLYTCLCYK